MPNQPSGENKPAVRPTEGSRPGKNAKGPETIKRRGRPAGSKNKPKSLLPAEVAAQLLPMMKERLPGEHYEYMRGVIMRGETISTEREVDALITLVRGSLMPYLAAESLPVEFEDDDGEKQIRFPGLNRDATDRLKLLNSLLGLKENIEKRKANAGNDESEHVLLKVIANRNLDPSRLAFLAGYNGAVDTGRPTDTHLLLPGSVAGDSD